MEITFFLISKLLCLDFNIATQNQFNDIILCPPLTYETFV